MASEPDLALGARIVARRPMRYRGGAEASLDRPAHVRAASAIVWVGARLVVVQDDASFLGVVDPATGLVDDAAMAAGPGGARQFGIARGNKADKADLEAAIALDDRLIAFGSGGPHAARKVLVVWEPGGRGVPVTLPRPRMYDALERALVPAGTALNLEGAAAVGDEIWIANRGGDEAGGAVSPDVIARWPRAVLERVIADAELRPPAPVVERVALGAIDGVALHLAEIAVMREGRVWFVAAAEATASYFDDGEVRGAAIGVLGEAGRWAIVSDAHGAIARDKIEGIAAVPGRDDRVYACVDADDPDRAAELLEIELSGAW